MYGKSSEEHQRKEPGDDQYYLEIFRRVMDQHDEEAQNIVYTQFQNSVRQWFRSDASRTTTLRYQDEQNYIDDTFKRFWQSAKTQHIEFPSLVSALQHLRLCLNSVIIDTLRAYTRKEILALPESGSPDELLVEDNHHESEWWSVIESLLTDERERRVIYLLYHCGLQPREIVKHYPDEFANEQEIYHLRCYALERLRCNRDSLHWKPSEDKQ